MLSFPVFMKIVAFFPFFTPTDLQIINCLQIFILNTFLFEIHSAVFSWCKLVCLIYTMLLTLRWLHTHFLKYFKKLDFFFSDVMVEQTENNNWMNIYVPGDVQNNLHTLVMYYTQVHYSTAKTLCEVITIFYSKTPLWKGKLKFGDNKLALINRETEE